jgi:restriction system protein
MSVLEAAETVLDEAGEPLHFQEITKRILQRQLWTTSGATPEATVNAAIAVDIKDHGTSSRFQRIDRGMFALRRWGLPEYSRQDEQPSPVSQKSSNIASANSSHKTLSFTDAAEYVLEHFGNRKPMHYRDITRKALELGLLKTSGQTPEATLFAQIVSEIARQTRRGETPRFVKEGKGRISLSRWMSHGLADQRGLATQIEHHNQAVRQKLHERLHTMKPDEFEALIGELLVALGFEEVTVTKPTNDNGIDVRGVLVIGDVIRLNMAVQVKRWKNNVQAPIVQQVRGSLGNHEQGLIITTSDFSDGARREAERSNADPVALMNGQQLVALLVEHNIGVHRTSYDLINLGEDEE